MKIHRICAGVVLGFMSLAGPTVSAVGVDAIFANLPSNVTRAWHGINLSREQADAIGPIVRASLNEIQRKIAIEVRRNKADWHRRVKRVVNKGVKSMNRAVASHLRQDQRAAYDDFSNALGSGLKAQRLVRNR